MPAMEATGNLMNALVGARKLVLAALSDTVDLPGGVCDALWVGGAGNIAIIAEDDTSAVTISSVAAGTRLDIRAKRVMVTNTTATLIVAWY